MSIFCLPRHPSWSIFTFVIAALFGTSLLAQSAATTVVSPRITGPVEEGKLVTLRGNTPSFAQANFDHGITQDDLSGKMLLIFRRSAEQEFALQQFLEAQQTPGSGQYHQWIKPTEFGTRFGIADADLQTVTGYLAGHGFILGRVYEDKSAVEVSGTAAQIRAAFHTQIHQYQVSGRNYFANQSDPQIPEALAPVIAGFAALNNFQGTRTPAAKQVAFDASSGKVHPSYDGAAQGTNPTYGVSPGDLKKLYDLPSPAGTTPATIGVVSDSNVNLAFLENYTSLFLTQAPLPIVVVDGNDPGVSTDSLTTLEQLEIISAVDPAANVILYTSASTDFDSGIDFAIIRAVEDDAVTVLNIANSQCEANLGAANIFLSNSWELASAEGMSVIAATGDSGSAACDIPGASSGTEVSVGGLAVNGYASTPFNTAIGGTDFYYGTTGQSKTTVAGYWSATNTGTPAYTSALGYIPEQAWNDSLQTYDQAPSTPSLLSGSGGGPSTIGYQDATPYGSPSWQSAASSVSATARVIPDLSFFAGNAQNYSAYLLCAQTSDCSASSPTFTMSGGTAAAAAVFSGIAGLLVQKDGPQGNLNPELYALQISSPGAFHDVTHGSNAVACSTGTGCSGSYLSSYGAATGYDGATGLGSVDASTFINAWGNINTRPNIPTVTLSIQEQNGNPVPPTGIVHGTPVTLSVAATGSAGTPTGDVSILTGSPYASQKGIEFLTLAGGTANDLANNDDFLPGGTYNLVASYPGNLTYAPAKSNVVPVKVTPEPSQVLFISGTLPGFNNGAFTGASVPYGTAVTVTVEPFSLNVNEIGIPSGSVQVFDQQTQTQVGSIPLNSEGAATMTFSLLALGSHSLVFTYSGDSSYQASSSISNSNNGKITSTLPGAQVQTALSFVVTTDTAVTTLSSSSTTVSLQDTSATLTAVVEAATLPNTGVGPSGSVKFSDGNTVPLTLSYDSSGNVIGVASEVVTPNLILGGTVTYDAQYVPDAKSIYSAGPPSNTVSISENLVGLPSSNTTTTIAASAGGKTFANTSTVVFNIQVVGKIVGIIGKITDVSGTVTVLENGVAVGSPVSLNAGSATFTVPTINNYLALPNGPVTITAEYNGDGTINGCLLLCPEAGQVSYGSDQITITGNTGGGGSTNPALSGDFSIAALTTAQYASLSSPTATYGLQLTSLNNYSVNYGSTTPISLVCSAPTGLSCSFSSSSVVGTTTVSLSSAVAQTSIYVTSATNYTLAGNEQKSVAWPFPGGLTLACVLLGGLARKRKHLWPPVLLLVLVLSGAGLQGCGSASQTGTLTSTQNNTGGRVGADSSNTVSTGTYQITVVASATTTTKVIHNVTVNLVVQ